MAASTQHKILNIHERGITLVSNAVILDVATSQDDGFERCANSYMLYDNLIYRQDATIESLQEGTGSGGVLALKDGNTSIKWESDGSTQVDIDITLPLSTKIDCMSVAGANLTECLAAWDFFVWDPVLMNWNRRAQGSGKKDNSPIFLVFDEIETPKVRFRFFVTGTLRVGELGCGKALRFPSAPSVGFTPSKWQSDKEVMSKTTESNAMVNSNLKYKTVVENPQFKLLDPDWLDEYWADVIDKAPGLPVWFAWNQKLEPNKVIYGDLSTEVRPAYETSLTTSLNLTITGNK